MINFLKSQNYLMLRSKKFYILAAVCYVLIILAGLVLYFMGQSGSYFPYDNARFYYVNVVGFSGLIIIISVIVNQFFHTKEIHQSEKVSIAFDMPKKTLYFGKFFALLYYFFTVCLVSFLILITMGSLLFEDGTRNIMLLVYSIINMAPMIFGALAVGHALFSSRMNAVGVVITILLLFTGLKQLFYGLTLLNKGFEPIYKLTPQYLLDENLQMYISHHVDLGIEYWIIGLMMGLLSLVLGYLKFKKLEH